MSILEDVFIFTPIFLVIFGESKVKDDFFENAHFISSECSTIFNTPIYMYLYVYGLWDW